MVVFTESILTLEMLSQAQVLLSLHESIPPSLTDPFFPKNPFVFSNTLSYYHDISSCLPISNLGRLLYETAQFKF